MSKYRLEISQAVRDLIIHLPPQFKRKVKAALQALSEDPYQAKELKDELSGLRRFKGYQISTYSTSQTIH